MSRSRGLRVGVFGSVGPVVLAASLFSGARVDADPSDTNWPRWRGPEGTGVAPHGDPPVEWSETKNVRWKVETPGLGTATPAVWEDKIFLLTAVPTGKKVEQPAQAEDEEDDEPEDRRRGRFGRGRRGRFGGGNDRPDEIHRFVVLCLNLENGKTVWERTVNELLPHEGHRGHSLASASPVTDGELLFAHFGSRGLFCLDLDGEVKWSKDLGDMRTRNSFGEGASPAVHGDTVVVNWDHEGDSFIIALDRDSGEERWRKSRDERSSWTTPVIVEVDGSEQVIVNGSTLSRSYDLKTGDLVWSCSGQTDNVVPTPVVGHGNVYLMSGFRGNMVQAISLEARGDLSGSSQFITWSDGSRGTPYVPSPLLYGDRLYYFSSNRAILTCRDAKSGEKHFGMERIDGLDGVYASPVGAAGKVYLLGREGGAVVIKDAPRLEVLATNELDDRFDASPAIVGGNILLRGHRHLYCIGKK